MSKGKITSSKSSIIIDMKHLGLVIVETVFIHTKDKWQHVSEKKGFKQRL